MAGNNRMAYLAGGAGIVLVWSAVNNRTVLGTIQDLVAGKKPAAGPGFTPTGGTPDPDPGIPPGGATQAGVPGGSPQGQAKQLLAAHGWSGQWDSFNKLEMGEAGWNPRAKNKSSGAFGLAQALGHGTSGTMGTMANEYGGFGLSDNDARKANSGDSGTQLIWMMNYIQERYQDPNHAYMTWRSRNPHWY